MQGESDKVARLKSAYALWRQTKGGSMTHWLSLMADDIDFQTLPGEGPLNVFTRPRTSRKDAAEYLTALVDTWEMLDYRIDEFIESGERVVAIGSCSFRHRANGAVFTSPKADLWRFKGGVAHSYYGYIDTQVVIAPTDKPVESRILFAAQGSPDGFRDAAQEQANIARLQDGYWHWLESKGGSVERWMALMDPDIDFRSVGAGARPMPFTRARGGIAEAAAYLGALTNDWEMVDFPMNEFIAQGDRVAVVGTCTFRFRRNGRVVTSPKLDLWRFKNGKATSFFEFFDTQAAFAATRNQPTS